jgi:threonine synthase
VTTGHEDNPFIRHRRHLDTYHSARRRRGWTDQQWVDLVRRLDDRVAEIDGTGFAATPLVPLDGPFGGGEVWAKVETANVSGSHKARHLFGVALALSADGAASAARPPATADLAELAIASCGNAALAAATIAAALGRPLRVFVPSTADPAVLDRLDHLGARVTLSRRAAGQVGDPCIRDLREAISGGAVPFTVQGTLCPGTLDGGRTLGLELAEQLAERPLAHPHLFVQVGGGALATSTMEGLARAGCPLPVLHPVQARDAHPFVAAWDRLRAWRSDRAEPPDPLDAASELAQLMQPWPAEPTSVATGILDDVTHDWLAVASWVLRTGGVPVLAEEGTLVEAAELAARQVVPPPDATGAAGLAGLLTARRCGIVSPGSSGVVLLTGVDRRWEAGADRPRRPVAIRTPG